MKHCEVVRVIKQTKMGEFMQWGEGGGGGGGGGGIWWQTGHQME